MPVWRWEVDGRARGLGVAAALGDGDRAHALEATDGHRDLVGGGVDPEDQHGPTASREAAESAEADRPGRPTAARVMVRSSSRRRG